MNCIKRYINSLIGFCWHPQIVLWLPVTHHGAIYKINKHKQINGNFPFSKGTLKLFAFSFFVCFEKLFHLSQFWESNTGPWKCWASPLLLCCIPSPQSVCLFVDRVSCGLGWSQTPSSPRDTELLILLPLNPSRVLELQECAIPQIYALLRTW